MRRILLPLLLAPVFLFAQSPKQYSVGVLFDNLNPQLEPVFEQFMAEVQAVVGQDATLTFPDELFLVNGFDLEKAEQNYQAMLANEADIILAFGVINNTLLMNRDQYPKPTILFGAVNQDLNPVDLN